MFQMIIQKTVNMQTLFIKEKINYLYKSKEKKEEKLKASLL